MGWFNHQLESHDEDPYEATCFFFVAEADLVGSPRPFFTLTEQWGLLGGLVGLVAWLFAFGKHRNLKNGRDKKKQNKKKQEETTQQQKSTTKKKEL